MKFKLNGMDASATDNTLRIGDHMLDIEWIEGDHYHGSRSAGGGIRIEVKNKWGAALSYFALGDV